MLKTNTISYQYSGQEAIVFPELNLNDNENLLIVGASGCGKTTLLHILSGLLDAPGDAVILNEIDLQALHGSARDSFRGKNIGLIFQNSHLFSALTVKDNVEMAAVAIGNRPDPIRTNQLLEELGITHLANKRPSSLSVGEQQRVNIARAVYNKPAMILADEPTSALDANNCEKVLQLLLDSASKNSAHLVLVTHDHRVTSRFEKVLEL